MFYSYILFIFYLCVSCASQAVPSGGPIDKDGPQLLNIDPTKDLLNIEVGRIQQIRLEFIFTVHFVRSNVSIVPLRAQYIISKHTNDTIQITCQNY